MLSSGLIPSLNLKASFLSYNVSAAPCNLFSCCIKLAMLLYNVMITFDCM